MCRAAIPHLLATKGNIERASQLRRRRGGWIGASASGDNWRMRIVAAGAALAVFLSRAAAMPPIVLEHFPIGLPGVDASNAALLAALDHKGTFYTQCCDTTIVVFTGETAERGGTTLFCPAPPDFPICFITPGCVCGYEHPTGASYVVNGNYLGSLVGPSILSYDGHAGYDYGYPAATPLVATKAGMLCKAVEDFINGHQGFPTAWDKFHTFYVDHGTVAGAGFASWYLHASALEGALASLTPGSCAPVASGQVIARVGNQGTILPHLHFEVRRYVPADGPEAATSQVVDPYGWTGSTPDPWEDPQENPQAAYNPPSLWGERRATTGVCPRPAGRMHGRQQEPARGAGSDAGGTGSAVVELPGRDGRPGRPRRPACRYPVRAVPLRIDARVARGAGRQPL